MVKAWYMDSSDADQREPHQLEPNQPVSLEYLGKLGVKYYKEDMLEQDVWKDMGEETHMTNDSYQELREKEGYSYEDQITCSREKLPDYDNKLKAFFKEHLHSDDEVRYVVDGSGYFDVRDMDDRWIRIEVVKDDLITLPAGIYHRFTLDVKNYIQAKRLFKGEPVWTPINRPADDHEARKTYLDSHVAA